MHVTIEHITPFLARPIAGTDTTRVNAWLTAISVTLTTRYPTIPTALLPLVHSHTADAVSRRLTGQDRSIAQQTVGPASVRYTAAAGRAGYFLPEELAGLDTALGVAGTRSYRTPAP
ncbi:hypothetical protein [Clavibacter michiganensis]|uniref:Uncharacterized protein n=1 Tax=Clavibacter michiganensis TaxID=28447 RepID=A0A251YMN9_9MICO|nr:hypothetical protein [Clavibacter michiganensis]OUE25514.1 hypothetical protein BFL37_05885 [Clavibacter michiganensis]